MNSFAKCQEFERLSRKQLEPFLEAQSHEGRLVFTDKGRLSKELQKSYGDVFLNSSGSQKLFAVEIKSERSNKHGSFFLETWSNLSRFTLGWMFTLNADILLYHFYDDGLLYSIPFQELKDWAFRKRRIYSYQERPQSQHQQLNDTWGRCCSVDDVISEVRCNCYQLMNGEWCRDFTPQESNVTKQAEFTF